jgi:hypothetical protein
VLTVSVPASLRATKGQGRKAIVGGSRRARRRLDLDDRPAEVTRPVA